MALQLIVVGCNGLLTCERPDGGWQPVAEGIEATARLSHAGYHVVVTDALPARRDGGLLLTVLAERQIALQRLVGEQGGLIDAFFFCSHPARQACDCRPPNPGLYRQIAARWRIDLAQVPCIAAAPAWLAAATAAGGHPVAIGDPAADAAGDHQVFPDLDCFVDRLLEGAAA